MRSRIWLLIGGIVVFGVLVGFFVTRFLNPTPPQITATTTSTSLEGRPVVDFNLTTVAAVVHGRYVCRASAIARHREQFSNRVCGGIPCKKDLFVKRGPE